MKRSFNRQENNLSKNVKRAILRLAVTLALFIKRQLYLVESLPIGIIKRFSIFTKKLAMGIFIRLARIWDGCMIMAKG